MSFISRSRSSFRKNIYRIFHRRCNTGGCKIDAGDCRRACTGKGKRRYPYTGRCKEDAGGRSRQNRCWKWCSPVINKRKVTVFGSMKISAGARPYTSGHIYLDDKKVIFYFKKDAEEGIAMIYQEFNMIPEESL